MVYKYRWQATEEFILRLKRLKSVLLTTMHIWAGQLGCGLKITTLKHYNIKELPWNVFIFNRLVILITDHNKQRKG